MTSARYTKGSVEYLSVEVTSADIPLDTQPVSLSIDHGANWLPCTWQGSVGLKRVARTQSPVTFTDAITNTSLLVKVTDSPEVPIFRASGFLTVTAP